ncbi:RNA polymerase sigma factor [Luteolibacter sp. LG18]|uniref:RNA polymerase sigma factor n=1 Tax=Luteolibacter sp. LG18 TaxID=2819286 RepID=UPI0030C7593B
MESEATSSDWDTWLAAMVDRFLLFARQQTRCGHDAEDVLQESLVETWKRAGGRPESALVFATIRRRAIDLGRRTDRRVKREQAEALDAPFTLPAHDDDAPLLRELEGALAHLPAPQREVLTLKFWGGLTFEQVAATLEIPQGTAASRYRSALETLRHSLTPALS